MGEIEYDTRSESHGNGEPAKAAPGAKTVLVVDDDPETVAGLAAILQTAIDPVTAEA